MEGISIFWFRRDLRLSDNAGLSQALRGEWPVLPLFIFDTHILDKLENRRDARVHFIHDQIKKLSGELRKQGSSLLVRHGRPENILQELIGHYPVRAVYTNRDYEPYAKERDRRVKEVLEARTIDFHSFKDHVIFEDREVVKDDGDPYVVFTPYSRKWKALLGSVDSPHLQTHPTEPHFNNLLPAKPFDIPTLGDMGFEPSDIDWPGKTVRRSLIRNYDKTRNFPGIRGTSRLGIHYRFGTISIREKMRRAMQLNQTYTNELIWREFYSMILANFPHVAERSFRPEYDWIRWRNDEDEFERWCSGNTGYPLVDAGMREINTTGFMHNRVRMVTASFLCKHLLIDWRWGEAYFAEKLLDYELASNNGGWQWAAGSGTDAAPYFRIFNPTSQLKKFDKDLKYVRKWIPEYGTDDYPEPMVDHRMARERCLKVYKTSLAEARNR